jgi:hypothetical protein
VLKITKIFYWYFENNDRRGLLALGSYGKTVVGAKEKEVGQSCCRYNGMKYNLKLYTVYMEPG